MKEPETDAEWKDAVLMAHALRALEDCRIYGLITGGPVVDVARCDYFIDEGRQRGMQDPSPKELQKTIVLIVLDSVYGGGSQMAGESGSRSGRASKRARSNQKQDRK